MGVVNVCGVMVIVIGNKSELVMGYCILYGDMNGGYVLFGDFYKIEVYVVV